MLPRTNPSIIKLLDCSYSENIPSPIISHTLSSFLYDTKECLTKYPDLWDVFKKYTNPYEYIHSTPPYRKKNVSKYNPLSRSYFKMIEIIHTFHLKYEDKPCINTFHLAEGPGGFIEAIVNTRKCPNDRYVGMTIIDTEQNDDSPIPGWKRSNHFLKKNPNIFIETGADNTGNILSFKNLLHCYENYSSSMDLVTADGGFDFSLDFNKQEVSITQLLFGQICYALIMQKWGGSFVIKMFDVFMQHTIDLIYLLSSFYEKVFVLKPNTSRYANSEKYIVCVGFIYKDNEIFYPYLRNAFMKMLEMPKSNYIQSFLKINVPYYFLIRMEEINSIFGQKQIENIHYTISIIESYNKQDRIDAIVKTNIQKCIQWCLRYNVEYNNTTTLS